MLISRFLTHGFCPTTVTVTTVSWCSKLSTHTSARSSAAITVGHVSVDVVFNTTSVFHMNLVCQSLLVVFSRAGASRAAMV